MGANERLKLKNPSALLTVEDLSRIYAMIEVDDDETFGKSSDCVQWDGEDHADDENIAILSSKEVEKTEQSFAVSAFIHGKNICNDDVRGIYKCNKNGTLETGSIFEGLRVDTCTNHSNIISIGQYIAYCRTFDLPQTLGLVINRTIA